MRPSIAVAVLGVVSLLFTQFGLASAYQLYGGKQPTTCSVKYSYRDVTDATYKSVFDSSRWSWNGAGFVCWTQVTDGSWKMGLQLYNNNSLSWDGYSYIYPAPSSVPYSFVYVTFNRFYTDAYSTAKKQSVGAHEIGHAWGIAHPSSDGQQLMNSHTCGTSSRWCSFNINTPKTDDLNAWNAIY